MIDSTPKTHQVKVALAQRYIYNRSHSLHICKYKRLTLIHINFSCQLPSYWYMFFMTLHKGTVGGILPSTLVQYFWFLRISAWWFLFLPADWQMIFFPSCRSENFFCLFLHIAHKNVTSLSFSICLLIACLLVPILLPNY